MCRSHEKNPPHFPWNAGCLIGILIMVHYNPHITEKYNPPVYPKQGGFLSVLNSLDLQFLLVARTTDKWSGHLHPTSQVPLVSKPHDKYQPPTETLHGFLYQSSFARHLALSSDAWFKLLSSPEKSDWNLPCFQVSHFSPKRNQLTTTFEIGQILPNDGWTASEPGVCKPLA